MVELVRRRRRQAVARHEELEIAQRLGGVAVGDAFEAGDQEHPWPGAASRSRTASAVLARERRRSRPTASGSAVNDLSRTSPRMPCARADLRDADALRHSADRRWRASGAPRRLAQRPQPSPRPRPWRPASARSLRFLPGLRLLGLLRASRFSRPAASRKRSTRSVGWAPLASQALAFSMSSLRRSLVVLRQQRIEVADPLDEAAVARRAGVGDDDVVERPLLGAGAGEADFQGHWWFLSASMSV